MPSTYSSDHQRSQTNVYTDAPYTDTSQVATNVSAPTFDTVYTASNAVNVVPAEEGFTMTYCQAVRYIKPAGGSWGYGIYGDKAYGSGPINASLGNHTFTGLSGSTSYVVRNRIIRVYSNASTTWGSLLKEDSVTTPAQPVPDWSSFEAAVRTSTPSWDDNSSKIDHGGYLDSWTTPEGFSYAKLYLQRKVNSGGSWTTLNTSNNLTSGYSFYAEDSNINRDGTRYYYRCAAKGYGDYGNSNTSYGQEFWVEPPLFDPPTGTWNKEPSFSVTTPNNTGISINVTTGGYGIDSPPAATGGGGARGDYTIVTREVDIYRGTNSNGSGRVKIYDTTGFPGTETFEDSTAEPFVQYYYWAYHDFEIRYEGEYYGPYYTWSSAIGGKITAANRDVYGSASVSLSPGTNSGSYSSDVRGTLTGVEGSYDTVEVKTRWAMHWPASGGGGFYAWIGSGWTTSSSFNHYDYQDIDNNHAAGDTWSYHLYYEVTAWLDGDPSATATGNFPTGEITADIPNYTKYSPAAISPVNTVAGEQVRVDINVATPYPTSNYDTAHDHQVQLYRDNVLIHTFPRTLYSNDTSLSFTDYGISPFTNYTYKTINTFRTYYLGELQTNTDVTSKSWNTNGEYTLAVTTASVSIDANNTVTGSANLSGYTGNGSAQAIQALWYKYNSDGTGEEAIGSWTTTSIGTNVPLTDSLEEGVTKKYRLRGKATDSVDNNVTYAYGGYSSSVTGNPPISSSGSFSCSATLLDNDTVRVTGSSSDVTSSAGYSYHRIYIEESSNGSSWATLDNAPTFNSGSSGSETIDRDKSRGSTWWYRTRTEVTSLVNSVSTTTTHYSDVVQVDFPVFNPPTGEWEMGSPFALSEDNTGITVTSTVDSSPYVKTGDYTSVHTYKWVVYRRVKGNTSWDQMYEEVNLASSSPGQEVIWKDTTVVDFTVYEYTIHYYFYVIYEGLRYGSQGQTSSAYWVSEEAVQEQAHDTADRVVAGTASAIYTDNPDDTLNGYATLTGEITSISGNGTVTQVNTQWKRYAYPSGNYNQDEGSPSNQPTLPSTHNDVSGLIDPTTTWTYKLYYSINVLFNGSTSTYTGAIDGGEVTGEYPHPYREMVTTINSISNLNDGTAWDVDWSSAALSPFRENENVISHSSYVQWRVKGTGTWSSNPAAYTSSYADNRTWTERVTGLSPFTEYEVRVITDTVTDVGGGVSQNDTTIGPVFEKTTNGSVTVDISKPTTEDVPGLSKVSLEVIVSNYSRPDNEISYIDYFWEARDTGLLQWTSDTSRVVTPTLPLVIQGTSETIPEGSSWTFTLVADIRNDTLNSNYLDNSPESDPVTGYEVVDRDVDVTFPQISNTASGIDIDANITGLVGPGYDSVSLIDSKLQYRINGSSDAWTTANTTTQNDDTLPMSVGSVITGLTDATVYDIRVNTRVVGSYLSEPFDYTVDSQTMVMTYNAPDSSIYTNDMVIDSVGYGAGGIKLTYSSAGVSGGQAQTKEMDVTVQRRLANSGDTWVDLDVELDAAFSTSLEFIDTTGSTGTYYDYRIKTDTTVTNEVGDGVYNTYEFTGETDHQTIEFIVPILELVVDDYSTDVTGYFSLTNTYTAPSAGNAELKGYEFAPVGTTTWTYFDASSMDLLTRKQVLSVRQIWGYTGDEVTRQPSNMVNIIMEGAPNALTGVSGLGRYSGNVITWSGGILDTLVEIKEGSTVLTDSINSLDNTYLDYIAPVSTLRSYTIRQYYEDAGFRLYSTPVGVSATRPVTPPLPALPEIDSAAYFGKDTNNNAVMHLAPTGTPLNELKSPVPLSTSFFHSASNFVVVTDIKPSTGSLDTATKSLLASRAFLCTIIDSAGTARASELVLRKSTTYNYGTWSNRNYFASSFSFGSNTAYYDGGSSISLPSWATSVKFYFLNFTSDGQYLPVGDSSNDILINKTNLKVAGLSLENAMLLCGIGNQSDGTVVDALNYHDDIIPFNGGIIDANTYTGPTSTCLQVLGSADSTGWEIKPNKGRIDRIDGIGNTMPWWNAGFGRSRTQFLSSTTSNVGLTYLDINFDEVTETAGGYYESTETFSSTAVNAGAQVLLPLGGTHESGDMYGIIVTPTGDDQLDGTVSEVYASGKGTLVWSDLSSSVSLAEYNKTYLYTYNGDNSEPEVQRISLDYTLSAAKVGSDLRLSISGFGRIEGRLVDTTHRCSVAPLRITIIKMR